MDNAALEKFSEEKNRYRWDWIGIRKRKRPGIGVFYWECPPREIVQTILNRVTKYKPLSFDQVESIARKACQKHSGTPERTMRVVCPDYWRESTMHKGLWDLTETRKRQEAAYRERIAKEKAERIKLLCEQAEAECKSEEIAYCVWPKQWDGDNSFWEESKFYLMECETFLKREIPEGVCTRSFEDENGVKRLTPLHFCESCKRIGGRKKVRFYSWYKNLGNGGHYCVKCWNRLRPVWKVESEWKGIKTLANKLEREAKQHGKAK